MGAAEGSRAGADTSPAACVGGLPPPEARRCRLTSSAIAAAKTSIIICQAGTQSLVSEKHGTWWTASAVQAAAWGRRYLRVDFDQILPCRKDGAAHLMRARNRIYGVELALLLRGAVKDLLA